jgi:hypothetical protein
MGQGLFIQKGYPGSSNSVCEEQYHLSVWNARNDHHRQHLEFEQLNDGPYMPTVQDQASQFYTLPPKDERCCPGC